MPEDRTVARVRRQVRKILTQGRLGPGRLLIVAVSGGPDSLALLYILHSLQEELSLRLHGAHLDHGIRGDASKADALFAAETFRRLRIPFTLEEADVPAFRLQQRLSLEQAARQARYSFLARVFSQQGAAAIAVGHTADDQAETVLIHLLRGSGLHGLRGMEATTRRNINGAEVLLVRPLLALARQDTLAYCHAMGLEPRQDESNFSTGTMRNRVRIELLPLLESYNPAVRQAIVRLSRSASQDLAYIEEQTTKTWGHTAGYDLGRVKIDRPAFRRLASSLQHHLLRQAVLAIKGNLEDLEQNHLDDMARLIAGRTGASLDLPDSLRLTVGYKEATLSPSTEAYICPLPPLEGQHQLKIPGETYLPGWQITAQFCSQPEEERRPSAHRGYFQAPHVGDELWIRSRRPGDRFQPAGMAQDKKLQDFMVDSKVPRACRDRVPLVVSPGGIAWVVGWRVAEWARARVGTSALELCFTPARR